MITGLYTAVLAFLQIVFTLNIVRLRRGNKVSLGDGGHDHILRKIRAHGNFTETVPLALILMILAELSGSPLWCIHVLGLMLIAGRTLHYAGITTGKGYGSLRFYGMVLTLSVYLLGGLLCLWMAVPFLLSGPLT